MSILKSTNSGKNALFITKENLLRLGWKRIPNNEGRDYFYKPDPTKPGGYDDLCKLEYKSMENPKWFLNIRGQAGYYEEGFYINACDLEYLVKSYADMALCERYWASFKIFDVHEQFAEMFGAKDEILICNEWNIKHYDPELKYYKSKHGDPKHHS